MVYSLFAENSSICSTVSTQYRLVTDRQTDRQTDRRRAIAYTALAYTVEPLHRAGKNRRQCCEITANLQFCLIENNIRGCDLALRLSTNVAAYLLKILFLLLVTAVRFWHAVCRGHLERSTLYHSASRQRGVT